MTYSSVIFDLDGTLLDTLADIASTCNDVLAYHNYPPHPTIAYKTFVGDGLQSLIRKITPVDTEESVIHQCCSIFIEQYSRNWLRNTCPYEGIGDMVSALKKHGIKLAVLSNKPHEFTEKFVEQFFPRGLFTLVYGQRDGFPKKPDPTVALEITRLLGVRPQDSLFVGDSAVDILTGRAAGMATAGVAWGFRTVQELTENKANIIVHHPLELQNHVLSTT
ncbi:MAG: HAD family hydrolase [Desulforhopalus sp.]